ncbi:MAG: hypothetical protein ACREFY_05575 [Acetobacteraceae bacterium]
MPGAVVGDSKLKGKAQVTPSDTISKVMEFLGDKLNDGPHDRGGDAEE